MQELVGSCAITLENASVYSNLQRSEALLAAAQRLSHTGCFCLNVASGEVYWSAETHNIFEHDPASKPTLEMIFRRVHPDDRDRAQQTLDRATEARADFDLEHRLLMPNGSVKHLQLSARAWITSSGDLEFVGAVANLTAAKEAEEKRRQDEHELLCIIDTIPQLIIVYCPDGQPVYANRGTLEYMGLSLEQVQSESFRGCIIHPEDMEWFGEVRQGAFSNGVPFETEQRVLGKDGKYRWFLSQYNPLKDEQGRTIRWYVTATDIEDRKEAVKRLQNENVALREEVDCVSMFEEIVGASTA